MRRPMALLGSLALAACVHHLPNSDINDNPDTRAIVQVIDQYRTSAERRDAAAVLALVSPSYFDDAGTPDPADDMDYAELTKAIVADYQRVPAVRMEVGVRQ